MKSNVKKHSLLNKSLVVFLLLNMVACSTVKDESVNANSDVAKTKSVEYSNANISKMIEKVVNKVVWNDEKVVDDVNDKVQSLNSVFSIIDFTTDKLAMITDRAVELISSIFSKLFIGKKKKGEDKDE